MLAVEGPEVLDDQFGTGPAGGLDGNRAPGPAPAAVAAAAPERSDHATAASAIQGGTSVARTGSGPSNVDSRTVADLGLVEIGPP